MWINLRDIAALYSLQFVLLTTIVSLIQTNNLVQSVPLIHRTAVPFGRKMVVSNRTVTCSGDVHDSKYPSLMYTCNNIMVNGQHLFHSYSLSGSGDTDVCAGCRCFPDYDQPNNILALCQAMFRSSGIDRKVTAAYVVKPSCSNGTPEHLVKFIQADEKSTPYWTTLYNMSNVYITTLQCLTQS